MCEPLFFPFYVAVIKMEGGTEHDLLSLDQPVSSENGDKSMDADDERRDKEKDSK